MIKYLAVIAALFVAPSFAAESAPAFKDVNKIEVDNNIYTPKQYFYIYCIKGDAQRDDNGVVVHAKMIRDMSKFKNIQPAW